MDDFHFYTLVSREYFETLDKFQGWKLYIDSLHHLLPPAWSTQRSEIWLHARGPETKLPAQGFKVHVSCRSIDGIEMLERIVPVCVRAGVQFKIVADPILHQFINSKRYARGGAGKFATIYPVDGDSFLRLLQDLACATRGCEGPYILSDRRYRDSKVLFYRYGGFQKVADLKIDGSRRSLIRDPSGRLVPDQRLPHFVLPSWIQDPINNSDDEGSDDDPLNGRYKVTEALAFSNTGGVYRAFDLKTGQTVVIKEGRPHTQLWIRPGVSLDAEIALDHEFRCLSYLSHLDCVPRVIDLFKEWEHAFLVTSFVEGTALADLRVSDDFILISQMHNSEHIRRFCGLWRQIGLTLLEVIKRIHREGVILGDISPKNVFFNRTNQTITLIDLEGAFLPEEGDEIARFGSQWFNPGFRNPDARRRTHLTVADDYYACGMLLYNLVCPIQTLFELDERHPKFRVLDYLTDSGLPSEVRLIIKELLDGRSEEARAAAAAWRPEMSKLIPGEEAGLYLRLGALRKTTGFAVAGQ